MYTPVFRTFLAASVLLTGGAMSAAAQKPADKQVVDADNTKVNKRDRAKSEPTADQAKENSQDREIMSNIRKALMNDKSLSTYARNVKIIAQHGKVTLKGPVRSEEEKQTIVTKATEIAGAGNVSDELTVKAPKTTDTKKETSKKS